MSSIEIDGKFWSCNVMQSNGMEWNGMEWNGTEENGI
jgi:hypothetical protein